MKKTLFILIVITLIIPNIVYAGCFPRKDIYSKTIITPTQSCLKIYVGPGCIGTVELSITNNCKDVFIYEKDGKKIELYNHSEWLKVYKTNLNAKHNFYDSDVPQEYIKWSKELYYKNNPNNKILIEVNNVYKMDPTIIAVSLIGIALIIYLFTIIYKLFSKKNIPEN